MVRGPFGEPIDITASIAEMTEPDRAAIVALVCDDNLVPQRAVLVDGTESPAAIHGVADVLERALVAHPELAIVLLVAVRPAHPCEPADFDRLLDLTARFDAIGVELVDWWIWSGGTRTAMRAAAGLPPRW